MLNWQPKSPPFFPPTEKYWAASIKKTNSTMEKEQWVIAPTSSVELVAAMEEVLEVTAHPEIFAQPALS